MFARRLVLISFSLCAALSARTASAITIDTVPIGNPGNANDPATGNLYGGVPYNYRMGKYDVTIDQYVAFLNAVAATDTYELYNPLISTDLSVAGVTRTGSPGSYHYGAFRGFGSRPIAYVSWGDAARFSNWLDNGQPTGVEGPGTTETGSYTLNGAITDEALNAIARNPNAKWVIPSESEWYKAAYYDAAAGHYWNYATGTNMTPTSAPPGSTPNTANFFDSITGFAVTGSTSYSDRQNYLTNVGAYTASPSPYGTFDQSGNVFNWNEALITHFGVTARILRGGSWPNYSSIMQAADRNDIPPSVEYNHIGFRVAVVPEPNTASLAIVACGLIWWRRKRFNV